MISFPPGLFKAKALRALKGNWQTALLITFFSTILFTLTRMMQAVSLPDISALPAILSSGDFAAYLRMVDAINAVPLSTWSAYGMILAFTLLASPMLELGKSHYYLCRLRGVELGFTGLFSRMRYWGKALLLSIIIFIKVFLWSLLLFVPGVIATIRYRMAYYFLAEDPSISAWTAVEKSKQVMKNTKMSYFFLELSFLVWTLLSTTLQLMFGQSSAVFSLIIGQCLGLLISTYMDGSVTAFFLTVSDPAAMKLVQNADFSAWMDHPPTKPPENNASSGDSDQSGSSS